MKILLLALVLLLHILVIMLPSLRLPSEPLSRFESTPVRLLSSSDTALTTTSTPRPSSSAAPLAASSPVVSGSVRLSHAPKPTPASPTSQGQEPQQTSTPQASKPSTSNAKNNPNAAATADTPSSANLYLPPHLDPQAGNTDAGKASAGASRPASCANVPTPPYPNTSRIRGEQGSITLQLTITTQGTVRDARILKSSGYERLDYAAIQALASWRCTPAQRNGVAINEITTQEIHFSLN